MKLSQASLVRRIAEIILGKYTIEKDSSYKKLIEALKALSGTQPNWTQALSFLEQIGQAIEMKEHGYKDKVPAMHGLKDLYKDALEACKEKNTSAIEKITEIISIYRKSEDAINRVMYPTMYRPEK